MSYFSGRAQGGPTPYAGTSTDASLATLVGARFDTADGREFVLVQNAGTALVAGNLIQGPAQITNHSNQAVVAAVAVGGTTVTVTLGGTLVTLNQYAGGFLIVNAGAGIGQTLRIASHPAQATSNGNVVITLEDPVQVALTTSSKATFRLNPYGSSNGTDFRTSGVVVCPTALTGQVIGVTAWPIPATSTTVLQYGLIQTRGLVSCLNDATTAIGLDLMPSSNTAGAVMTYVVATATRVGTATQAGVTTEARHITVQL